MQQGTTELHNELTLYEYAVIPPDPSVLAKPNQKTRKELLEERIDNIFLNEIKHILDQTQGGHSEKIFLGDYQVTSINDESSESGQRFKLTRVVGLEEAKEQEQDGVEINKLVDLLKQDLGFKGGKAPKSPTRRPYCKILAAGQSPMTDEPFPIFRLLEPPQGESKSVYTFLTPLSRSKYYSPNQLINAKAPGGEYYGFSEARKRQSWSDKSAYYTAHYKQLEDKNSSNSAVTYYQQVKCSDDDLGRGLKDFYFDYEAFKVDKSTFVSNTYKPVSTIAAAAIAGNVLLFHFVSLQDIGRSLDGLGPLPFIFAEAFLFVLLIVTIDGEYNRQKHEYLETALIERDPESTPNTTIK